MSLRSAFTQVRGRLVRIRARMSAIPIARPVRSALLLLESVVTFLPFLVSWLACAIGFSIMAGYQMARADSAGKRKALDEILRATTKP